MKKATDRLFSRPLQPREQRRDAASVGGETPRRPVAPKHLNTSLQVQPVAGSPLSSSPSSFSACSSPGRARCAPSRGSSLLSASPSPSCRVLCPSVESADTCSLPAAAGPPSCESRSLASSPHSPPSLSTPSRNPLFPSCAPASVPRPQPGRTQTARSPPTVRRGVAYMIFSQTFYAGQEQADDIVVPLHVTKAVFGTSLRRKKGWVTWYDSRSHRLSSTSIGQWLAESRARFLLSLRTDPRDGEGSAGRQVVEAEDRLRSGRGRGSARNEGKKGDFRTRVDRLAAAGEREENPEERGKRDDEEGSAERRETMERGEPSETDAGRACPGGEASPTGLQGTHSRDWNREGNAGEGKPCILSGHRSKGQKTEGEEDEGSRCAREMGEEGELGAFRQIRRSLGERDSSVLPGTSASPTFPSFCSSLSPGFSFPSQSSFSCSSLISRSSVSVEEASTFSTSASCRACGRGGPSSCPSSSSYSSFSSASRFSSAAPSPCPVFADVRWPSFACEGKRARALYVFLFLHGMSPPGVDPDVTENWGNLIASLLEKFPEQELREKRGEEPFILTWAFTYRRATCRGIGACVEVLAPAMANELGALLPFFDTLHVTAVGHSLGGLVWRFLLDKKATELPLFLPSRGCVPSERTFGQPRRDAEGGLRRDAGVAGFPPGGPSHVPKKRMGLGRFVRRREKNPAWDGTGRTRVAAHTDAQEAKKKRRSFFPFSLSRVSASSPSSARVETTESPTPSPALASASASAGRRSAFHFYPRTRDGKPRQSPLRSRDAKGSGAPFPAKREALRTEVLALFGRILNSPKVVLDVFCTLASPHVGTYKSKAFVRAVPKALSFMSCLPASEIAKEILNADEQQLIRCLVEHEKARHSWLPFQGGGGHGGTESGEGERGPRLDAGDEGRRGESDFFGGNEQQSFLCSGNREERVRCVRAGGETGCGQEQEQARERELERTSSVPRKRDGGGLQSRSTSSASAADDGLFVNRSSPCSSATTHTGASVGLVETCATSCFVSCRGSHCAVVSAPSPSPYASPEADTLFTRPAPQSVPVFSSDSETGSWSSFSPPSSSCVRAGSALLPSASGAQETQRKEGAPHKAFRWVLFYGVLDTDWLVSVNSALGTCIDLKLTPVGQEAFRHPMRPVEFSLDKDRKVRLGRPEGGEDEEPEDREDDSEGKGRQEKSEFQLCDTRLTSSVKKREKEISLVAQQVEVLQSLKHLRRFVVYIPQNPVTTAAHATIKCSPNYVTQETQRSMRKQAHEILQHITAGLLTGATNAVGDAEPEAESRYIL
ncbi:conserved hypothetical protein [Neospora caninum Liverpool]|uniref:Uncharacterized protein n=1 Tax=Neospora caninum (strain Liverpool) TaxID=572307 RepID=F0VEW5_NEOCL|nr:conserved hypothetical protein [Neospora caninum Liverpool]CBZ52259.1 conserved hypothetical protein [Neospora caninum Liverpool]CEL66227.1 TPA: hypothetical protein BN1204_020460 [Neospora caninum Liverpool]|eukprot:XP_003882291.1 conserved hypothetical protein [Neospora caninum Liverpool]